MALCVPRILKKCECEKASLAVLLLAFLVDFAFNKNRQRKWQQESREIASRRSTFLSCSQEEQREKSKKSHLLSTEKCQGLRCEDGDAPGWGLSGLLTQHPPTIESSRQASPRGKTQRLKICHSHTVGGKEGLGKAINGIYRHRLFQKRLD